MVSSSVNPLRENVRMFAASCLPIAVAAGLLLASAPAPASESQPQEKKAARKAQAQPPNARDVKVRADKKAFEGREDWIYNDLTQGVELAKATDKPILIVFRCIPCENCQEFDDSVARRDPKIRELMDQFICVRIVRANDINLKQFQYDFDQSFAMAFMNADSTLYGRFGTRSARMDEEKDITLEGLRKSLEGALKLHRDYKSVKPSLAGKQSRPARFASAREYPSLRGKYQKDLNYNAANVAQTCLHCHQIGEAIQNEERSAAGVLSDRTLFPYPNPKVLGMSMDPETMATVAAVESGSSAERDGVRPGDRIARLEGQPILSTADIQWILHAAPGQGRLNVEIERGGATRGLDLTLDSGWRRRGDISWRTTTWNLRRMVLGGMALESATDGEPGLRVKHVGQYGEHKAAWDAGVRAGDRVIAFDGLENPRSETELIAHASQKRKPGDTVMVKLVRGSKPYEVRIPLR